MYRRQLHNLGPVLTGLTHPLFRPNSDPRRAAIPAHLACALIHHNGSSRPEALSGGRLQRLELRLHYHHQHTRKQRNVQARDPAFPCLWLLLHSRRGTWRIRAWRSAGGSAAPPSAGGRRAPRSTRPRSAAGKERDTWHELDQSIHADAPCLMRPPSAAGKETHGSHLYELARSAHADAPRLMHYMCMQYVCLDAPRAARPPGPRPRSSSGIACQRGRKRHMGRGVVSGQIRFILQVLPASRQRGRKRHGQRCCEWSGSGSYFKGVACVSARRGQP